MAQLGRPKSTLALTSHERSTLTAMARAIRRNRHEALRARIVLACSADLSNREVAGRLGLAEHTVGKWRARFVAHRLSGLANAPAQPVSESLAQATWRHLSAAQPWLLGALFGLRPAGEPERHLTPQHA